MTIDVEEHAGIKVLHLRGELAGDEEHALVNLISELLEQRGLRCVMDMGAVSFMNSAGLGDLVRVAAQINTSEGRVMLARLSPFVTGVLQSTRLDRFFEVAPSVEDALQRMA
ncbi:MAG TPA: STAS domain-containing protein [Phycisphaerae bacterium]|nr:STAS domain-containing protein [Phycisphaerae bacterium]HNU45455.1 STAS domain-containing protein [Phycisphaerae bacterium]